MLSPGLIDRVDIAKQATDCLGRDARLHADVDEWLKRAVPAWAGGAPAWGGEAPAWGGEVFLSPLDVHGIGGRFVGVDGGYVGVGGHFGLGVDERFVVATVGHFVFAVGGHFVVVDDHFVLAVGGRHGRHDTTDEIGFNPSRAIGTKLAHLAGRGGSR